MPFKSEAQRRFMYANHPEIAAEFEDKTPKGKKLPKHVKKKATENQEFRTGRPDIVCNVENAIHGGKVATTDFDLGEASEKANHATGKAHVASENASRPGGNYLAAVYHKKAAGLHEAAAAAHGVSSDAGRYHSSMAAHHAKEAAGHIQKVSEGYSKKFGPRK